MFPVLTFWAHPVEVFLHMSMFAATSTNAHNQRISLLPDILVLLLIIPAPDFSLAILGFIQIGKTEFLPRLKAFLVHKFALCAGRIAANHFYCGIDIEDVFSSAPPQTVYISWWRTS